MELLGNGIGKAQSRFHQTYEEVEVLSKTEQSTIYLVRRKQDGLYFVCKQVKLTDLRDDERDALGREIAFIQNMRHPNVIKLYETFQEGECIYCVQEYCQEGDLQYHIKQQSKKGEFFSQEIVESWVLQVLLALEYLHNIKIVHRDIKASNVFLTANGNIKVGSFKLSKDLHTDKFATTFVGTPYYMSPEILESKAYDSKTDIWSLGCLIFELCALRPAFSSTNILQLAGKIIKGEPDGHIPSHYSKGLSQVIRKCLSKKLSDRPSAKQLLRSQYFLNVMQRFISKNGRVSEAEQKIPIKKYEIHKKLKDAGDKVPKTPSTVMQKKKVSGIQPVVQPKSDKKPSARKSVERKEAVTPLMEAKSEQKKSSKDIRRSSSHERRKSIEKKKPATDKSALNTPQNVGKVQGKKMALPLVPKPSGKKSSPQFVRSAQLTNEIEQVNRVVQSEIRSPDKESEKVTIEQNEQKETGEENWMDGEDIDYTISMTKKNLAAQLQSFKKNKPHFEQNIPSENSAQGYRNIFESLIVREDDDSQPTQTAQGESDPNRLTMKDDEIPQLLTQYKTKMEEVCQQLNYRYGPNMQIIIERTNEFGSDEFAKQKPTDQN